MTSERHQEADLLPVLTATEMREREQSAFGSEGVSERVVLESAGRAVAHAVARAFPDGRVAAAVGGGNNGGDAIVAIRTLRALGRDVVAVLARGAQPRGELAHGWEVPIVQDAEEAFSSAVVLIDGLLGTGAGGAPRDAYATMIRMLNGAGRPIVAVDGPSGVDLTTGAAEGEAVEAALTVTFGALKRGLLLHPGRRLAGRILLAEVGFPPFAAGSAALATDRWAAERLPRIALDAHKGAVGLVGIVAGRPGYGGAPILAAMGALRTGCGGARIVSAGANRSAVHAAVPEAVFVDRDGPDVEAMLAGTKAIVLGPGIGTDPAAAAFVRDLLRGYDGSVVLDADATTLLAADETLLPDEVRPRCILTPHPGEMARLLGAEIDEILDDRFAAATRAAERYGCAVLAKGAPSIVAAEGRPTIISIAGHSGIATGGMGDTLSGVIATLMSAGADPVEAGAIALQLSGRAAERAGRGRGLLPRDVAEALPDAITGLSAETTASPPFILEIPPAR
jgi:ADP-dependent NAD(P)H-hydrate dehydratase / NAD(P)H-hydrate epimerase